MNFLVFDTACCVCKRVCVYVCVCMRETDTTKVGENVFAYEYARERAHVQKHWRDSKRTNDVLIHSRTLTHHTTQHHTQTNTHTFHKSTIAHVARTRTRTHVISFSLSFCLLSRSLFLVPLPPRLFTMKWILAVLPKLITAHHLHAKKHTQTPTHT